MGTMRKPGAPSWFLLYCGSPVKEKSGILTILKHFYDMMIPELKEGNKGGKPGDSNSCGGRRYQIDQKRVYLSERQRI